MNNEIYYERRHIYMKNKRKALKNIIALLLCVLMAAGTAVPAFAMEEVSDDFRKDFANLSEAEKQKLTELAAKEGGFNNLILTGHEFKQKQKARAIMWDSSLDGYSLDKLKKYQALLASEIDEIHKTQVVGKTEAYGPVLEKYMKFKHPGYDDPDVVRANDDWANIATAFSIFQGISSVIYLVQNAVSFLQMMGVMKGEPDPSVAVMQQLGTLRSSVDEVDRKLDAIQDTLVNDFAELDLKLQQQDYNHYKDDVWAKFYTDAVVPVNNIQTEYSLRVNDLLLDYITRWQEGENKTDLRALYGRNEENGEIMPVYSGRNLRDPGRALPKAPEVSLDAIPVEYAVVIPAEYITGNMDKTVYLTSDNFIEVLKNALTKGVYQAAEKGELTAYPGFESEWSAFTEEEKQAAAKEYADDLASALTFACSYNAVNEKGFSSDVKNAYLNFTEWLQGSESLTSPLTAQLKMLSLSHVFEGEVSADADNITYYLCMMNQSFHNFTQSVLAMSKSQSEEQKLEVSNAYYASEITMTRDYTNFITGNPNYCYVTGTVLEYKNTTLESTMKSYHVQFDDSEFLEENENTQYAIPEGFNYSNWKIFEKGTPDSEKDASQADLMLRTVTPKQARIMYAMYETAKTGTSFSDYLVDNSVAASAEQITTSGIITSFDTENLDLNKETVKMTCYLPSNHGTYAYTPGKEYTVKSGVASDLNVEGNYRLHDKATGGLLDLTTGKFNENAPLEYRVYYHGTHNNSSGSESSVHRLIAFSTTDFSSTDTMLPWGSDELRGLGGNWWKYTCGRTESVFTSDRYGMLVSSSVSTYTFSKSTKTIGSKFFGDTVDIEKLVFEGTPESIADDAFENVGTSYSRCLLSTPFATGSLISKWHGGYFGNAQITAEKNDGSGEKESVVIVNGAPISEIVCTFAAPDNATFDGWSFYPNGAVADSNEPVTAGMTIYAKWKFDHEHDFEVTGEAVAPTCTKNGASVEKTCKICGYKDVEILPATGHSSEYAKIGNEYIVECSQHDYYAHLYPKEAGDLTIWSEDEAGSGFEYIAGSSSGITWINEDGVYVIESNDPDDLYAKQTVIVRDGVKADICLADVYLSGNANVTGFTIGKDANVHLTLNGRNKISCYQSAPFVCAGNLTVDGKGSLNIVTGSYFTPMACTGENTVINGGCLNIQGGTNCSIEINENETGGKLVITQNACVITENGIDAVPVNEKGERVYPAIIPNTNFDTIIVDGEALPHWVTNEDDGNAYIYLNAKNHEITVNGEPIDFEPFNEEGYAEKQYGDFTVLNPTFDPNAVSYENGVLTVKKSSPITIKNTNPDTETRNRIEILPNVDADITLAGVNINLRDVGGSPISIGAGYDGFAKSGKVKITLEKDTENILHGGTAGISMAGKYGSLTIDGEGTLYVTGEHDSAAIGSSANKDAGDITINGGTIHATAGGYFNFYGSGAAAIGSGKIGAEASITSGYATGNITINGGKVYANSAQAPAVGAGVCEQNLTSKKITVNGGMLIATSDTGEYSIGGSKTEGVVITGGIVTAATRTEGKGGITCAGHVIIENTASVKAPRVTDPTNGFGKSVSLNVIPIDPAYDVYLNGKGYKCIGHNGESKIYLYLAEDEKIEKTPHIEFEESERGIVTCLPDFPKPGDEVTPIALLYEGYSFVGFEISPDVELKDGSFIMPDSDLTIKGIFAKVGTVTVTESEHGRVMPSKSLVSSGEKVTLRALPDEGYELDMLTVTTAALEADGKSFIMPEEDVTITCTFKEKTHTVTWNADGETTQDDVLFGSEIVKPEDPKKEGFTFKGWTPEIPETMPDADLEFYAVFEPITYTAKFIADGTEIGSVEYTLNMDKLDEPAVPEKIGYTGKWEAYTLAAGGITVNAVYTPIEYTARFIANGELVADIAYTMETVSITEPEVPEKAGYIGAWGDYALTAGGITVKAVYTPAVHEHTFDTDYDYNDIIHWHPALCDHDVVSGIAVHTFVKGAVNGDETEYTCTVCDYVKTVTETEEGLEKALIDVITAAENAIDSISKDGGEDVEQYAAEVKTEIEKLTDISEVNKQLAAAIEEINAMKTEAAVDDALAALDEVTATTDKSKSLVKEAQLLLAKAQSPEEVDAILADVLTKIEAAESAEADVTLAKTDAKDAIEEMAGEKQSDEMKSIIADVESVIDAAQTTEQVAAALELGEAPVQTQLDKEAAEASLEEAKTSLADAESALMEAQNALKEKADALEEAEDKLEEANKALDKAKKDLDAKDEEIKTAEESLAAAQTELDEIKKELAEKSDALKTAQDNLANANKSLEDANKQVEALTADLKEVNDELTETKSALGTVNAQIDTLTADLKKANDDLTETKSKLDSASEQVTALTADLKKANEDLDKAESDLADAKAEVTSLTADLKKANEELAETKAALNEAKSDLNTAKAEKSALESQLASKETELENLRKSGEAKDEEIKALEKTVSDLNAALKSKDDEITAKAKAISDLEKAKSDLEKTIETQNGEIAAKTNTISSLEKSVDELEKTVEDKNKEIAEKSNTVTALEKSVSELEKEVKEKEDEIAKKEKTISDLEKSISNLEASVQAKETEVSEKTEEIKKLENSVEDLEDEVAKAQENIEKKTSQVEELTEKLEEAQAEIEELKGGPSGHEDICPKCGKKHKDNFFGRIACFFNRIGNFFRDLFQKIF